VSHDACAIAIGAVSALGEGPAAYRVGPAGAEAEVAITKDPELTAAGLRRPFAARAPGAAGDAGDAGNAGDVSDAGAAGELDRASALLTSALGQALASLERVRPGFRCERVGVVIGTSSGGMLTAERFFAARASGALGAATPDLARGATYFAPLDHALAEAGLACAAPRAQILAACAASTVALGIALRWLERSACDLVLAGGYDAASVFVASGFEALRATTASRPAPFRRERDGMAVGEGAAVVALVRGDDTRGAAVLMRVAGFGASNDAVHITAPDRTGEGLARAARAALADAGLAGRDVDLVSAHGTATPFNDAMEARAIAAVTGRAGAGPEAPPVHPFKAQIGHTLGAAGVLESLAAAEALRVGIAPAAAGAGTLDPDAEVLLLLRAERRELRAALKLSAAFGGTNAALLLTRGPSARRPRPLRRVFARAYAHVEDANIEALAAATGVARERLARLDALCRLGLAAVAALASEVSPEAIRGAGIVAGHALATIDTNERYDERRRARGAIYVEPRLFPATSPNALTGECAIAYGLTGPSLAVGSGLDGGTEALACAAELVAAGDADRVVVVASDDAGPVARDMLALAGLGVRRFARGAVALLVTSAPASALREVPLGLTPDHEGAPIGHLALLRFLGRG
jgi:3-oxoacyl-[acyl-carrier-protein] synthase II